MTESSETQSRFIRLRGLPWSVTHQEIIDFLENVNVVDGAKGIHLVTNRWDGKNTGEAFVEIESEADEEQAFKRNKESLGHRYIEVFSASNEEAEHAIRKPGQPSNVVKLRGLPYAITEVMIEEFFTGLEIKPDREGILIVMDKRGRATGEAYVQFETQEDTEQALKRHREKIGHRYIEIFRSSAAEMRRQISGNRPGPYDKKDRGSRGSFGRDDFGRGGNRNQRPREIWATGFGSNGNFGGGGFGNGFNGGNIGGGFNGNGGGGFNGGGFGNGNNGGSFGDFDNFGNNRSFSGNDFDNFGNRGGNFGNGGGTGFFNNGMTDRGPDNRNNFGGFGPIGGGRMDPDKLFCIHLRGLPYYCFENDVMSFFSPLRPVHVKIIYNNTGLHSGSADAYFDTHEEAVQAMKKHREKMGSRYIELFYDGKGKRDGFRRL